MGLSQTRRHSLFGAGHARPADTLPVDLLDALNADADRYRFDPGVPPGCGTAATASLHDPAPAAAARWLAATAGRADLGGPFAPNDAGYHCTPRGSDSTAPLRTSRFYAECVAVVVLRGHMSVSVHAERDRGLVLDGWSAGPGDVVLLRGWSPLGQADPRPYHRFAVADGRSCLTLRVGHNLVASVPPSPWLTGLTRAEITTAGYLAARPVSPCRPAPDR
ncbi:hypothetical protein [Pseudonocardia sp. KRD291]|uniref:hypothetical protein n=1 Tax=Pseudonocardia sp. KRD291 TaxID=2792007 RepID=UPI001C4A06AB|nr:hypothetical protein [Pseudonocardia sp. KRD291]MBW0105614.1 hypothetical protein [Pseudonocardia sp. KRD291]